MVQSNPSTDLAVFGFLLAYLIIPAILLRAFVPNEFTRFLWKLITFASAGCIILAAIVH